MNKIIIQHFKSQYGELLIGSFQHQLCLCDWLYSDMRKAIDKRICDGLNAAFEKGDDKIGTYRSYNVKYDPLEPNPYNDPEIKRRNDKRKESKSYIDMPNISSLAFLFPRSYTVGLKIDL